MRVEGKVDSLGKRIDGVEEKLGNVEDRLSKRIDGVE
jgi:hypothetical protein